MSLPIPPVPLQPVFRLKLVAMDPAARTITVEIQALNQAPIVAVMGVGQTIQYSANIIDPAVLVSPEALAVIDAAARRE